MQEATATRPPLNSLSRFMTVLQKIIEYGHRLTTLFDQAADTVSAAERFLHFGTTDVTLILARIKRGLLRAQVLEMSLQRDPTLIKDSLCDYPAPPLSGIRPPGPRPAPTHTRPTRAEREDADNQALLARMPSVAEIAEQIRHRNPGDVLFDICRDLGIMPSHPLYMEISCLAIVHGGNTVPMSSLFGYRIRRRAKALAPHPAPPTLAPPPPEPALAATGPP